jgi:phage I-like protein
MDSNLIILLEASGGAPEWFRLLPLGRVQLGDGREAFTVTPESLTAIVQAFKSRGVDLVIDYEHQSATGERAPAAGWIKELEARNDGLWARVEWTQTAQSYLAAKEYRYFSPVVRLNKAREVTALLHAALTNVPAMNNLPALAAKFGEGTEIFILAAGEDPKAAQAARAKKYGIGVKDGGNVTKPGQWDKVPDEQFADPVNYLYPMLDHDQCRAAWDYWSKPKNQEQYSPPERATITERIKSRAKAVGMQIQQEVKAKMITKLKSILGLDAEAEESAVIAALEKMRDGADLKDIALALELKPEATPAQIKGAILGLKAGQGELSKLQGEVTALKAGKITPAQKDWALKMATESLEGFREFMKTAPVLVPVGNRLQVQETDDKGGALTEGETEVCRQLQVDPEKFRAEKMAIEGRV